ncbi:MAG: DUF481 domain-containing protein [Phycisphaerales bacterium]|nr:DUF481 domain-containing protein [Planctomycetota bacterium]MCH8509819.1 DUF481 domain-containing protein [Phycisphaerales bacterium]
MGRSADAMGVLFVIFLLGPRVLGGDAPVLDRLAAAEAAHAAAIERLLAAEAELRAAESAIEDAGLDIRTLLHESEAVSGEIPRASGAESPDLPGGQPGFFDWDSWTKSFTIGVNGASGNATFLSSVVTATLERKTDRRQTRLDGWYRSRQRSGQQTEHRARLDLRHDRLAGDERRWRWWVKGTYEYDQTRAWRQRASGHTGLGYDLISRPDTSLGLRMGLGGTQTFGGDESQFDAEALLTGLDLSHDFGKGRKLTAGTELFMDLQDGEDFRINSTLRYEVLLDPERGMLLRAGLDHRFESSPEGHGERSDLLYSLSLGWRF